MPAYDYECSQGHVEELVFPMDSAPQTVKCKCGRRAKKIISVGGIQDDHPIWLDGARNSVQCVEAEAFDGRKPIENRTDYNRYIKEHGLVPYGNRMI
jgi:putative FmdB family regulatory protein